MPEIINKHLNTVVVFVCFFVVCVSHSYLGEPHTRGGVTIVLILHVYPFYSAGGGRGRRESEREGGRERGREGEREGGREGRRQQ